MLPTEEQCRADAFFHEHRTVVRVGSVTGPLVLALGPAARDHRRYAAAERFAAILMGLLSRRVRIEVTATYTDLLTMVGRGETHLAWLPPALYVTGRERYDLQLLVGGVRDQAASFRGALFTKSDSPIQTPEDLQGTRVAWVDPFSCAGYLFPRLVLREHGLDPDQLFSSQFFPGDHAAVARAVALGQAEVGATFVRDPRSDRSSSPDAGWTLEVDEKIMKSILTTEPIPADVIVGASELDADFGDVVTAYLAELHTSDAGQRVIHDVFGVERFEPVSPDYYDRVAAALEAESAQKR